MRAEAIPLVELRSVLYICGIVGFSTMDLLAGKLVAMVCLFFLVLICGGLPIWLFSCFRSATKTKASGKYCTGRRSTSSLDVKQLLCALNSFAGGVFLGTCMLDLLPEAREAIQENNHAWPIFLRDYPLTELTVILGVVLLMIVELGIEECTGKIMDNSEESILADHVNCRQGCSTGGELPEDLTPSFDEDDSTMESPLMEPVYETDTPSTIRISFRIIALILALSFHSLFDGLAIGLQTTLTSFASVFFAISVHKTVFAFSLGIRLAESGEKLVSHVYLYVLCFAAASPLGIAIGLMVEYLATGLPGAPIISGLLQSLATGTLMYVTFFEILPEEFSSRFSFIRILSLVIGIGMIAFLVASVSE